MPADRPLRVLHVTPSYFPATIYGGPIFSTKALFDGLAESGAIALRTLTTDSCGPRPRDRVQVAANPLTFPAGYEVRYCRRVAMASVSPGLLARLPGQIAWADVVHLTATYSFPTPPTLALARLMGKPVVWSPRGGLQATAQWADAPNRGRKMLFERLCQVLRPERTVLHVTAAMEHHLSRDRLPGIGSAIIPNIIEVPDHLPDRAWRPEGNLRLMFL
ncbi:MAG TPA: glycosyl transferase family 1, partial [Paracoccaceae bacterium]|nr:glycosyl transferase family 1 [Paracoccaceae bacterium]